MNRNASEIDAVDQVTDDFEQMIYLISHDLRNSVRAIIEIPTWIEEDLGEQAIPINGSLRENLDLINVHSARLNMMFADLLTYSRIGKNQAVQSYDLDQIISVVMTELDQIAGIEVAKDIGCSNIKMGDVDASTLIHALLSNAVKHRGDAHGCIGIDSHLEGADLILRVTDDGPGIPEKDRARVFDLFTTLKSRDEVEGSGMGLAIAKKIVRQYGGDIQLMDVTGTFGNTFEIRLPA